MCRELKAREETIATQAQEISFLKHREKCVFFSKKMCLTTDGVLSCYVLVYGVCCTHRQQQATIDEQKREIQDLQTKLKSLALSPAATLALPPLASWNVLVI
jgi:hypothetical protein